MITCIIPHMKKMTIENKIFGDFQYMWVFSSPALKAQVSFSDLPVVRHLSVHPSLRPSVHLSVNFSNFHLLLQNHFSRTTGPISTRLGRMHPWVMGIEVCSNEEQIKSHKVNNVFFLLLINIMI